MQLWLREHNRICDLIQQHPKLSKRNGDAQFKIAKAVVVSKMQQITVNGFLPALGISKADLLSSHGFEAQPSSSSSLEDTAEQPATLEDAEAPDSDYSDSMVESAFRRLLGNSRARLFGGKKNKREGKEGKQEGKGGKKNRNKGKNEGKKNNNKGKKVGKGRPGSHVSVEFSIAYRLGHTMIPDSIGPISIASLFDGQVRFPFVLLLLGIHCPFCYIRHPNNPPNKL